ncbi:uncharacterized protein BP5553_06749 [Venustampulla echinocandica]|uniref:Uncharacterized protein n=1 Tax=Venustampulla echinocandica TaxID=2656787 RepID=A0A370TKW2_9HELO|nr:uncharacterized protein BP5553_06749 [Venustampulla echinocandica]RDL36137.1 hypothetical protein BP5553_06749 [Venustampulla echinocandica]
MPMLMANKHARKQRNFYNLAGEKEQVYRHWDYLAAIRALDQGNIPSGVLKIFQKRHGYLHVKFRRSIRAIGNGSFTPEVKTQGKKQKLSDSVPDPDLPRNDQPQNID